MSLFALLPPNIAPVPSLKAIAPNRHDRKFVQALSRQLTSLRREGFAGNSVLLVNHFVAARDQALCSKHGSINENVHVYHFKKRPSRRHRRFGAGWVSDGTAEGMREDQAWCHLQRQVLRHRHPVP
ncbi:hypothetical protein [Mesorhizobium sp. 128a]